MARSPWRPQIAGGGLLTRRRTWRNVSLVNGSPTLPLKHTRKNRGNIIIAQNRHRRIAIENTNAQTQIGNH
eukprot:6725494-Lingulodinium_polyedra.AAC.1